MKRKYLIGSLAAIGLATFQTLAGSASWDFYEDPTTGPNPLVLMGSDKTPGTPDGGGDYVWGDGYGGFADGYLSISGPTDYVWGKIFFPDIDDGATVAAFTFECMLRIGNGTADPADGFSVNYARANDPVFAKDGTGNYISGGWSGTEEEPGAEFFGDTLSALAEEGTTTGLAIGFDAWDSTTDLWPEDLNGHLRDLIGISVRVDNKIVAQVPLPNKHTTCEDPLSLQTGPRNADNPSDFTALCWQPFKVQLTEDKKLSVWWKGVAVVENMAVPFEPSAGRLVFGGRCGGSYQNQHVDNISLTTIPADKALIGPASADPFGVSVQLEDAGSSVVDQDTVALKINGNPATPLDFDKVGKITTVRWTSPTRLASGADITVDVEFEDVMDVKFTGTRTAKVATYNAVPAAYMVPAASVDTGKPGFLVRPYQTVAEQPNTLTWTEEQLLGQHGGNIADLSGATDGFYVCDTVINFNIAEPGVATPGNAGQFNADNGHADALFPGFPGTTGLNGSSAVEVLAYLEFPTAGLYQFGVWSDDGFRLTTSYAPGDLAGFVIGQYDGGRSGGTVMTPVLIEQPGFYPIRLIWENGAGELPGNGANLELYTMKDGVMTLVNDTTPDAVKAYRESTAPGPYMSNLKPLRGTAFPVQSTFMAEISHGSVTVDDATVKVQIDGADVAATPTTAGGKTTVTAQPPVPLFAQGAHTVKVDFSDKGSPAKAYSYQYQINVGAYQLYQAPYGPGGTWNLYLVDRYLRTWTDAEAKGRYANDPVTGLNKPGHLVSIHSADEATFVAMIGAGESVWIGLTDNENYGGEETGSDAASSSQVPPVSGKFVWVSGEPYTYARWNGGEPNDWNAGTPGEDAIELYNNGNFNDNGISLYPEAFNTRHYVVEYETQLANKLPGVRDSILPVDPLPGPDGCDDAIGIRMIRNAGTIGNLGAAINALSNPSATVLDSTAPVINHYDTDGASGGGIFGNPIPFPGDVAGAEDNFVLSAKAKIKITEAGDYTFGVHSDDGFALRIRSQPWKNVLSGGQVLAQDPTTLFYPWGTGDANTRAVVNLAAGEYDLEFVWFENGGGADVELYAAKGVYTCDVDTPNWRLVGTKAQTPAITYAIPGVSADGWTVEYSEVGGSALNNIAEAEADLAATGQTVSNVPKVQYADPQAAGGTKGCYLPFPNDTEADDDDFAMRATAQLVIPVAGTYHFGFQGDDGGYLQIEGQTWDSIVSTTGAAGVINGDRIDFNALTGDSRTVGAITLNAGTYTIRTLFWERGGGGFHWVFGGPPSTPWYAPIMANGAAVIPEPEIPLASCGGPQPQITNIEVLGDGSVRVEWINGGTLQITESLTKPINWTPYPGTSPATIPSALITGKTYFARIVK